MAKQKSEFVKNIKLTVPESMEYYNILTTDKDRDKFVKRVERIVRSSMEYRDYIQFLRDNVGLDSCIFFQNISNGKMNRHGKVSIEMHHEPFTLYDIVSTVLRKYQDEGLPINDLNIADEVMKLHYENKVGLVPLSKTAHEIIHNSTKLMVPINMCYGNYSDFLTEYEPYISDEMYEKLERKMDMTSKLTPESFEAITKEFKYLDIEGVEDVEKMELEHQVEIA
jgi:hypothetical protein